MLWLGDLYLLYCILLGEVPRKWLGEEPRKVLGFNLEGLLYPLLLLLLVLLLALALLLLPIFILLSKGPES